MSDWICSKCGTTNPDGSQYYCSVCAAHERAASVGRDFKAAREQREAKRAEKKAAKEQAKAEALAKEAQVKADELAKKANLHSAATNNHAPSLQREQNKRAVGILFALFAAGFTFFSNISNVLFFDSHPVIHHSPHVIAAVGGFYLGHRYHTLIFWLSVFAIGGYLYYLYYN